MAASLTRRFLSPTQEVRSLLLKWIVALLVPLIVFLFLWNGDKMVNTVLLGLFFGQQTDYALFSLVQTGIFLLLFFLSLIALAGYLLAADTGRRGIVSVWLDVFVFALVPLLLIIVTGNMIIGLALCAIIWPLYFYGRRIVRKRLHYVEPTPLENLTVADEQRRAELTNLAVTGSFWFSLILALVWLIADLVFFLTNSLTLNLLLWGIIRAVLLPLAGYLLGRVAAAVVLNYTLAPKNIKKDGEKETDVRVSKRRRLEVLSQERAQEEAKNLVPNDLPLRSKGAQRFFLTILIAFVLFYPVLDPFLFGFGTAGRVSGYGDAGFYVILALGLNIVVGFAGLLDLGYVAFFAIGSYVWGMIGSPQFGILTHLPMNAQLWPWLFWPMLLGGALIAAFWGVVLGAPTLRLRGDYLAIVTLGFGEIIPIFFLELDKYTNGTNGLVGIYSPAFPGVEWSGSTPIPYYYLILVLIAFTILANIRLRDSRLGRAWVAIREDEIAASSSGVNLVNTKLFAFGAGAFFSGIAGAYYSAKLGTVSPDNFSFGDSIIYLAMVVIGGLGSIPGVIVGALAVYAINLFILSQFDTLASDPGNILFTIKGFITLFAPGFTFGNIRNLVFGIILVVIMIFRPEGLIPSARRRRELHNVGKEAVEVGALDAPPGAPDFESEARVQ